MVQVHGSVKHVPQVLSTAEVNELQVALCIQQQVFWFEVSVDHLQAGVMQTGPDDPLVPQAIQQLDDIRYHTPHPLCQTAAIR